MKSVTKNDPRHGSRLSLTLRSIHGMHCAGDKLKELEDLTVAVSFSGSSNNMQVSSFTMCDRTGNLAVESEPLQTDNSWLGTDKGRIALLAKFRQNDDEPADVSGGSTPRRKSSPHVSLDVANQSDNKKKLPLIAFNRDSVAVSRVANEYVRQMGAPDAPDHETICWDESPIPDILELRVVLRSQNGPHGGDLGVAHVVFEPKRLQFCPRTFLDLKVKPSANGGSASRKGRSNSLGEDVWVAFAKEAFVRVQVDMTPCKCAMQAQTQRLPQENIEDILLRLKENEEIAIARAKARNVPGNKQYARRNQSEKRGLFCNGGAEIKETIQNFIDAMTRCQGRAPRRKQRSGFLPDLLRASSTMESTIETRESMEV